jgi:hypothetical protein
VKGRPDVVGEGPQPEKGRERHPWAAADEDARLPLGCPVCGRATGSLKQYTVVNFTCLLVSFAWQAVTYTACPRCMRRRLAWHALIQLLPANLLWPVVTLVPDLIYVLLSCRRGHSPSIRDLFWRELVEVRVAMREPGQ